MDRFRINTIIFNMEGARPISQEENHVWFKQLGIENEEVYLIQYSFKQKRSVLKFSNETHFARFVQNHPTYSVPFDNNNEILQIPFILNNGLRSTIKITEVPIEYPVEKIVTEFKKYRKIINHFWQKVRNEGEQWFTNVFTEVVNVNMEIDENIPSFLWLQGQKAYVYYP